MHRQEANELAEGEWLEWYPDGTLRFRSWWHRGKGVGMWEYFYSSGQLRSETVYDQDRPVGIERAYHPNGALARETIYVRGERHGIERRYDPVGTELSSSRYYRDTLVVDKPTRFAPEVISRAESNEWGPAFSPTGDELFFARRGIDSTVQQIYVSVFRDGTWSTPTVAPFSTSTDESPALSPDGNQLYFASFRPLPNRPAQTPYDMNIWRTSRAEEGWTTPEPLPATINRVMQTGDQWPYRYEAGPTVAPDGTLYYWTALADTTDADIVRTTERADGSWTTPERVAGLSGPGSQSDPVFSPDGQLVCFSAYGKPDGYGSEDLYCARRTSAGWRTPVNLGPEINDLGNETGAAFSPDGKYFYFCSERGDSGQSDIYYLEAAYVPFPGDE
ncbi:Tol biopolymer transport system component [Lewinella aquimaris]|uniref:Tol biopolymer transport system component n=1 Tax=Neolewinella aquimaris TaxID=1835722 RepID=A0A840E176_9BACT|nr:PD40 domain-containing protein [Neolewinella aquimaris]MBB4077475.1 Tol biopolymer transport system component [Neolewinella aquimaris]